MTRFRDIRDQQRSPKASCLSCGSERLGAVHEPLELGGFVYCGGCGSFMVADVIRDIPGVRRPWAAEALRIDQDPAVKRIREAFVLDKIDAGGNLKEKQRSDGPQLLEELERARVED
jgi:hypothetical protein